MTMQLSKRPHPLISGYFETTQGAFLKISPSKQKRCDIQTLIVDNDISHSLKENRYPKILLHHPQRLKRMPW